MDQDIQTLRDFYYRSALGRSVQKRLQMKCREIWPDVQKEIIVGYGFASPLLRPFLSEASHAVNLMPAEQGVMAWPPGERNISVICNENAWPLGASSVDRVIVLHAIESAINVNSVFKEIYRVLAQDGRAILIVTNRLGAWSHNEKTPFGAGRPFGQSQLEAILRQHQFEIVRQLGALHGSPWKTKMGLRFSNGAEWVSQRLPSKMLAGVFIVEIQKSQMNKPIRIPKREPIFATPDLRPAQALRSPSQPQKINPS